jgi:hypothetical protein
MSNTTKENNKILNALNDFETAKKNIEKAIENLNKTHNNLNNARVNFNTYKAIKQKEVSSVMSKYGVETLDERLKNIEDEFVSCFIENESNEQIFIFDDKQTEN